MNRSRARTRSCTAADARMRRQQAREYLNVAELVLTEGAAEAHVAWALAVLGSIAAADAICGLRLGMWSRGEDHGQAATLLETVDLEDKSLPKRFRQVLSRKDDAHYSPHLVPPGEAKTLVRHLRWLVEAADRL